jgi:hypothetical protein
MNYMEGAMYLEILKIKNLLKRSKVVSEMLFDFLVE